MVVTVLVRTVAEKGKGDDVGDANGIKSRWVMGTTSFAWLISLQPVYSDEKWFLLRGSDRNRWRSCVELRSL